MSSSFNYKDFVYKLSPQSTWCKLASGNSSGYTHEGARKEFWDTFQREILSELQKEIDKGWEVIGVVGPSSIVVQTSREFPPDLSFIGCMGYLLLWGIIGLATYGIGLIVFPFFVMSNYARPVEFRVNLRRQV